MTIKLWRYSHLALAVSSFLLLILAAITGIILSFEPVSQKMQPYRADGFNDITLAQALPALRKAYPDISELTVDANQFVQIKASDANGKNLTAYVDPRTGKVLGKPTKQSEFFQWITTLHRSLFMHETGRLFIGITAFLLLLIALSGIMLLIKRQLGVKRFFSSVSRDGFAQYYHVVLSRWMLVPIIIIALTGTFLSLSRFGWVNTKKQTGKIDFDAIKSTPEKKPADIAIFKNTKLADVQSIEFPFSEDVEDYYNLKLTDREVAVNQITGDILSEVKYPTAVMWTDLSLNIHTGRISAVWSVVLAVASLSILFFIYSGFAITWKRLFGRSKNTYKAEDSEYIILVGSENGDTFRFAGNVHQQLLEQGKKVYLTELNKYAVFPQAQQLIIMTSTHGMGEAPGSASRFINLLQKYPQQQSVHYSVLGFGSHAYADFCQFAFEVNNQLQHQSWAKPLVDIHTVNDKSPDDFELWVEAWSQQSGVKLAVSSVPNQQPLSLSKLVVTHQTGTASPDGMFLLRLQAQQKLPVTSGDLLAIYPANDHRERLYSIGVVNNEIQLSVRLHANGLGSGFLHQLQTGDMLEARVVDNPHFHFPAKAPEVVMIANGTGIAPFLGMINQNSKNAPCHLYCGFRDVSSFNVYQNFLTEYKAAGQLSHLHVALSREGDKQYVSHLLQRDAAFIANVLSIKGVLMICGSLSMQKDVLALLENICANHLEHSVSHYQSHGQILMDCY